MSNEIAPHHDPAVATDRHEQPVELLRDLLRFDTTNPPGDEAACIEWIADLFDVYGIDYTTYARDPDRPVIIGRVSGGDADPLLLYGHVDVVPAEGEWTHPPFEAVLDDGYVWGRGALDMKGGVAMFLAAVLRIAAGDQRPPGDLLLCVVPDEEGGGDDGMQYMVDQHPEAFAGVTYALGEFGGFSIEVRGERFYPIQVDEKRICWLQATIDGEGGHGSLPRPQSTMYQLGRVLRHLENASLPVHMTPVARKMVGSIAAELSPPASVALRALTKPRLTDSVIRLMGKQGQQFHAITHNVVNPTVVRGGSKENVVPESVELTLDCRLVPGQRPADVLGEIRTALGDLSENVTFEIVRFDEGPSKADMSGFDALAAILESADSEGTAVPLLLTGASDARHLSRLGIQSYGFTPMQLPPELPFLDLIHAHDERIPDDAVEWGTDRVYEAIFALE